MLNVLCVLSVENNSRVKYDEEWVDKLYRSLNRNLSLDFNFYCFSNVNTKYQTIPLITNSAKFWNKIEIFRPNLFSGPCLYIDLDVLICNDITDFISSLEDKNFYMCREPFKNISNSSIMYWSGDHSFLFDEYSKDKRGFQSEYNTTTRYGDQSFISERVNHKLFDDKYVSWQHHKVNTKIDDNCKFLVFTSPHQKPTNNTHLEIVKRNWK
jgi:hypothetical protein